MNRALPSAILLLASAAALAEVASTQPAGESAPPPSTPIIREGSYIVNRHGRLSHTADGQQWQFTFDRSDAPPGEPTIFILPNLNLMLMENAVASDSHDIHFKITGVITEYHGKNYVLLQKVVVVSQN